MGKNLTVLWAASLHIGPYLLWGSGKMLSCGMRNTDVDWEYRIGLGLELGSGVRVRIMARAWVGVSIRVLFCSSTVQFLTILCILHYTDAELVWR